MPINDISIRNQEIPYIGINGTGIPFIRPVGGSLRYVGVRGIGVNQIADSRIWVNESPQAIPPAVPVTTIIGTPVINIAGCVKVHKENAKRDPSSNKNLVNDDPKGNVVLCDAGMPYYEPPDYDARELTWQTVTPDQEEGDEGLNLEEPNVDTPDTPTPDTNIPTNEEVECPPPNARRIGDRNQKGDEQVKEYKLTPDGKICETIWEPVTVIDQYLPSVGTITTTATIATVATASALFAKPIADLLLKVIKPAVKKAMAKVNQILGKTPRKPSRSEVLADQYRLKKGLLPLKKTKKKK